MCFFLDRILLQLMKDGARHMILLTIPPIPKLDPYEERSKTLKRYNEFIRKRHNGYFNNNLSGLFEKSLKVRGVTRCCIDREPIKICVSKDIPLFFLKIRDNLRDYSY